MRKHDGTKCFMCKNYDPKEERCVTRDRYMSGTYPACEKLDPIVGMTMRVQRRKEAYEEKE